MPVNLQAPNPSDLFPVPGVKLGIAMAGVRKANRRDLTVITVPEGAQVGGVFTTNRFCAAPVQLCQKHLAANVGTRALVINTGNANAGTGEDGLVRAFSVKMDVTRVLLTVRIQNQEQVAEAAEAIEDRADAISNITYTHPGEDGSVVQETDASTFPDGGLPKVGRNDPCPCGSGKKYKACHGKLS